MIRWKDKHAYNWIGIGESLHERYDTLPIGIQILTSPLYILLGILFTLHTMEWLMNLYCDMSERLLQKPNGLWSIMKVIVLIPSLPMIAYALPGWIYDKVKSRKTMKKVQLMRQERDRRCHEQMRQYDETLRQLQVSVRRSAIIDLPFSSMTQRWEVVDGMLKPTDKLSPTKKMITHKMSMT